MLDSAPKKKLNPQSPNTHHQYLKTINFSRIFASSLALFRFLSIFFLTAPQPRATATRKGTPAWKITVAIIVFLKLIINCHLPYKHKKTFLSIINFNFLKKNTNWQTFCFKIASKQIKQLKGNQYEDKSY